MSQIQNKIMSFPAYNLTRFEDFSSTIIVILHKTSINNCTALLNQMCIITIKQDLVYIEDTKSLTHSEIIEISYQSSFNKELCYTSLIQDSTSYLATADVQYLIKAVKPL